MKFPLGASRQTQKDDFRIPHLHLDEACLVPKIRRSGRPGAGQDPGRKAAAQLHRLLLETELVWKQKRWQRGHVVVLLSREADLAF